MTSTSTLGATPTSNGDADSRDGLDAERRDLLETLNKHRFFLRFTARGLTDEQASARPTVSELSVGGLVKHVTQVERNWVGFILNGPAGMSVTEGEWDVEDYLNGFRLLPGETLEQALAAYEEVARRTDELVRTVDLDASQPLPSAPWFEPGKRWTARRVLMHIVAETAQHAGHADIIRETIDGQKSMG
jgi:uncharacterized damage-inducible protein DinB